MTRQNPLEVAPNPNVRDMPEVPSQQKFALFNRRRGDVYGIDPGLLWDGGWSQLEASGCARRVEVIIGLPVGYPNGSDMECPPLEPC